MLDQEQQHLFTPEEVFHAYLLPHLPLTDMYHLSRTCTALQHLVSNAPAGIMRTAASQALPAGLVKSITPVHQLWALLRHQQRLMHRISHSPRS